MNPSLVCPELLAIASLHAHCGAVGFCVRYRRPLENSFPLPTQLQHRPNLELATIVLLPLRAGVHPDRTTPRECRLLCYMSAEVSRQAKQQPKAERQYGCSYCQETVVVSVRYFTRVSVKTNKACNESTVFCVPSSMNDLTIWKALSHGVSPSQQDRQL